MPSFDAVVVGGGIVGCACAYFLSEVCERVAVVAPGPIGGGATAAGMGHIVAMDDSEAQFALTSYSQRLWENLASELPASCEYRKEGTLWIADEPAEAALIPDKRNFYEARGVRAQAISEAEILELEPNLKRGLAGGLLVPDDAVIFPMPAAKWLLERSKAEHIPRAAIEVKAGTVRLADTSELSTPLIVNASGDLAAELTPGIPVDPRKGHLAITDRYPGFIRHQIVEMGYLRSAHKMEAASVAFNLQPRATGQILIGSSRQFVGWNQDVDAQILDRMLSRAIKFAPSVADLNITRVWTGFRAATPDKLPLIGEWMPGIWLAAGHEGLGITTSLATGKILADLVAGQRPQVDASFFSPTRFAVHV